MVGTVAAGMAATAAGTPVFRAAMAAVGMAATMAVATVVVQ